MISVVNGYVCTSSCEAANARQGENPDRGPERHRDNPIRPTKAPASPASRQPSSVAR
jgi:hypothetical protein